MSTEFEIFKGKRSVRYPGVSISHSGFSAAVQADTYWPNRFSNLQSAYDVKMSL